MILIVFLATRFQAHKSYRMFKDESHNSETLSLGLIMSVLGFQVHHVTHSPPYDLLGYLLKNEPAQFTDHVKQVQYVEPQGDHIFFASLSP
jgi:hypothetical protein